MNSNIISLFRTQFSLRKPAYLNFNMSDLHRVHQASKYLNLKFISFKINAILGFVSTSTMTQSCRPQDFDYRYSLYVFYLIWMGHLKLIFRLYNGDMILYATIFKRIFIAHHSIMARFIKLWATENARSPHQKVTHGIQY